MHALSTMVADFDCMIDHEKNVVDWLLSKLDYVRESTEEYYARRIYASAMIAVAAGALEFPGLIKQSQVQTGAMKNMARMLQQRLSNRIMEKSGKAKVKATLVNTMIIVLASLIIIVLASLIIIGLPGFINLHPLDQRFCFFTVVSNLRL